MFHLWTSSKDVTLYWSAYSLLVLRLPTRSVDIYTDFYTFIHISTLSRLETPIRQTTEMKNQPIQINTELGLLPHALLCLTSYNGHMFFWSVQHHLLWEVTLHHSFYRNLLRPHSADSMDTTFLLKEWPWPKLGHPQNWVHFSGMGLCPKLSQLQCSQASYHWR